MEVIESNKLIANFMGARYSGDVNFEMSTDCLWIPLHGVVNYKSISPSAGKTLRYHNSCDWLFQVLRRIFSLGYKFEIGTTGTGLYYCKIWSVGTETKSDPIDAMYASAINFIKWHNGIYKIK